MGIPNKKSTDSFVKDIRKQTRRIFTAEQKILIVMEGLRAETSVAPLLEIAVYNEYYFNKEMTYIYRKHKTNDSERNCNLQVEMEQEIKYKPRFKQIF